MIGGFIDKLTNALLGPMFDGRFEFMAKWWLLISLLAIGVFIWRRLQRRGSLKYSNIDLVKGHKPSFKVILFEGLAYFEMVGLLFLTVAAARPRSTSFQEKTYSEGIDIVVTLDISSTMRAEDFRPKNRLEAAKIEAEKFISRRSNDRIGLVVFAAKAFTMCPLTLDYGVLLDFLKGVEIGQIEDGTAIGTALATSAMRLKNSTSKSKIIVLLTDGLNNRGEIDPITAAKAAKAFGIRIYTIGAGKPGYALYPVDDPFFGRRYVRMPVEIDENTLKQIAGMTGGAYFRATDSESLDRILKEIDELEKTKIEVQHFVRYKELFPIFIIIGLCLLLADMLLRNTIFRKLP